MLALLRWPDFRRSAARQFFSNAGIICPLSLPGPFFYNNLASPTREKENSMGMRPHPAASKTRRVRVKEARKAKKYASRVMPMLSRPKKK
jgi:hypothetical protein